MSQPNPINITSLHTFVLQESENEVKKQLDIVRHGDIYGFEEALLEPYKKENLDIRKVEITAKADRVNRECTK